MSDAPFRDTPGTVLVHATVVPIDHELPDVIDDGFVVVEGGEITAVGSGAPPELPGSVKRVDASGTIVMPGLVNAHTHIFQTLLRGLYEGLPLIEWLGRIYSLGSRLTAQDVEIAARLGALESLLSGVTTLVDHQFLNRGNELVIAAIEGLSNSGIRACVARTIIDVEDPAPAAMVETPESGLAYMDELLAHYPTGSSRMLTLMTGPNTPGVSASGALVRAMQEYAVDRGIGVSMHVAESASVVARVREHEGVDGVARWLDSLGALGPNVIAAHAVHLDADEVSLFADAGVAVSHNPVSNLFLGDGIAPAAEMLSKKVTVALGTDGATSNNSQDMLEVLRVASILQRLTRDQPQLENRAYVEAATIGGARAIGLGDVVGSITVGKRADLIQIDLASAAGATMHDVFSHLVQGARSGDVRSVMVDGRWLVENREPVHLDADRLYAAGRESASDLVSRL